MARALPTVNVHREAKAAPPQAVVPAQDAAAAKPQNPAPQKAEAKDEESPIVVLSRASGNAGQTVEVSAKLERGREELAAVSTDVHYDPRQARVVLNDSGQPNCAASSAVDKSSAAAKQVLAKERLVGDDEAVLRVALLGLDNANPLPDGELFTCYFRIAEEAEAGEKVLRATSTGAGKSAQAVTVLDSESAIVVN